MINEAYEKALQSHYSRLSGRPCSHVERELAAELLTETTHRGLKLEDHELAWLRWFDVAYPPDTRPMWVGDESAIALTP